MARPVPWDGVRYFVVSPIKGGGWYFNSSHATREEAEAFMFTKAARIIRVKARLPRDDENRASR